MYRYGFELEGFQYAEGLRGIQLPHKDYPTDGFPGLIEIRTSGHDTLEGAVFSILKNVFAGGLEPGTMTFSKHEAVFTPEERRELRTRPQPHKSPADIRNIYGKKPRPLGNKTIASLQINISNLVRPSWTSKETGFHPDQFSLLDIPRIVKALDTEFIRDITLARRQPGEYCIKGDRLEYRSLPNSVFPLDLNRVPHFISRVRKAVENV